jgi:hypothetical protein
MMFINEEWHITMYEYNLANATVSIIFHLFWYMFLWVLLIHIFQGFFLDAFISMS